MEKTQMNSNNIEFLMAYINVISMVIIFDEIEEINMYKFTNDNIYALIDIFLN